MIGRRPQNTFFCEYRLWNEGKWVNVTFPNDLLNWRLCCGTWSSSFSNWTLTTQHDCHLRVPHTCPSCTPLPKSCNLLQLSAIFSSYWSHVWDVGIPTAKSSLGMANKLPCRLSSSKPNARTAWRQSLLQIGLRIKVHRRGLRQWGLTKRIIVPLSLRALGLDPTSKARLNLQWQAP